MVVSSDFVRSLRNSDKRLFALLCLSVGMKKLGYHVKKIIKCYITESSINIFRKYEFIKVFQEQFEYLFTIMYIYKYISPISFQNEKQFWIT
jgi:hypothetical protein